MDKYLKEIMNNLEIKENYIDNEGSYIEYVETKELNKIFNCVISKQKIKDNMKKYEWALNNYDCIKSDYKQSQGIGSWIALAKLIKEGDKNEN